MKETVELLVNNGVAVVVVGYFLARDWKYNERTIILLETIKTMLKKISGEEERED